MFSCFLQKFVASYLCADDTETSEPADTLQADVSAVDSSLDTSAAENAPGNHGFVPQHDEEQFGDGNSSDRTVESEPAEAVEATVVCFSYDSFGTS
jgi:hypothetical protein